MASNQPADQAEQNVELAPAMRAASPERRQLFGRRLRQRREDELGFTERKGGRGAFERATKWDTRNAFDMENAKRFNFKEETLRKGMRAYGYTRTSARAFLLGETDELVPAPRLPAAAAADVPGGLNLPRGLDPPPFDDEAVSAEALPYAEEIFGRLSGIRGEVLFPGSPRAAARWDDPGLRRAFSLSDRVWIIAAVLAAETAMARSSDLAG